MNKSIPLYYNEDKTAFGVLVSEGYGAGFSTWGEREQAYDRRIIEFWLAHKDDSEWINELCNHYSNIPSAAELEAKKFAESIGYEYVCWLGFEDCELYWVPVGKNFRIDEYDGAETLIIEGQEKWW